MSHGHVDCSRQNRFKDTIKVHVISGLNYAIGCKKLCILLCENIARGENIMRCCVLVKMYIIRSLLKKLEAYNTVLSYSRKNDSTTLGHYL